MQWTDIKIITDKKFEDIFDFVSAEVCPMGVQIEDYSDLEQQVEEIAHVDLIEQDCWKKTETKLSFITIFHLNWMHRMPA